MKPSLQKKFDPKKHFLGCVQRLGDPVLRPFLQVFFIASFTSTQSKQLLDSHFSHVNDYHNWITDDAQTVHVNRMLSNLDHKYSCWLPLCWRNHFSYRRYYDRLDFTCWEMWELGCALNLVSFKTHFTFFWSFFITCKETNGIKQWSGSIGFILSRVSFSPCANVFYYVSRWAFFHCLTGYATL
jgi:hypothetical protein